MAEARKLTAILAADIAGYSALMGADEERTVRDLKGHQAAVLPMIDEFGGRVIDTAGDGILAEFPSVVNAVECAVSMQRKIGERNAAVESERRMQFRIGINLGDVIYDGNRIFGDGINVAARLEGVSEPGGICVSNKVHMEIRGKLKFDFDDLGDQHLKNIALPVHVYRLVFEVERPQPSAVASATTTRLALPDKPSIAVLPFTNMSGDPEQDYFADGIVEDIITGLSHIKWLFVIARNSSFTYKGKAVNVKQIGRDLGVRYILEGSVRKSSNRVRVAGQVVEAETGRHVWAERYDRTLEDIFALQDELTTSVVAAIEPSLRQAEIERVRRKRPDNLEAYDLLLRALPDVYTSMPDRARKALPLLEAAISAEPEYAAAHGFAAWCHEILFVRGGAREENRLGASRHAHSAIAYGRDDTSALVLGGFALGLVTHDREAARRAFEAALAVSSSCAPAYLFGSVVMATGGDADRAIDWGERALRLSPLDPMHYGTWYAITYGHFQRGNYEAAADAARRCFQAGPNWSFAHMLLAATHSKLGQIDAARDAAKRLLELQPGYTISGMCAAIDLHASVAKPLSEALRNAGLPA
jgi:TolB-like protein/class 3 adenylate cyclase